MIVNYMPLKANKITFFGDFLETKMNKQTGFKCEVFMAKFFSFFAFFYYFSYANYSICTLKPFAKQRNKFNLNSNEEQPRNKINIWFLFVRRKLFCFKKFIFLLPNKLHNIWSVRFIHSILFRSFRLLFLFSATQNIRNKKKMCEWIKVSNFISHCVYLRFEYIFTEQFIFSYFASFVLHENCAFVLLSSVYATIYSFSKQKQKKAIASHRNIAREKSAESFSGCHIVWHSRNSIIFKMFNIECNKLNAKRPFHGNDNTEHTHTANKKKMMTIDD